mmetsp:Transcript_7559/g.46495  ORF Transcript_7559/g.46495 Transcript_7559/m.46495 type:complete len:513 (-) Transcript_7559:1105-2643(-)
MRVAKRTSTRCGAARDVQQDPKVGQKDRKRHLPRVAIVGRPNVGKSALFNRITGGGAAIVHDEAGVTRDRSYVDAAWEGRKFTVVDTGGVLRLGGGDVSPSEREMAEWNAEEDLGLPAMVELQAKIAMQESNVAVLVVDGQQGVTQADRDIVQWLRRDLPTLPVLLAVNKCESTTKGEMQALEFWELGMEPRAVSAISGYKVAELLDDVVSYFPEEEIENEEEEETDEETEPVALAIVGRPNVGKSSLLNAITGENRCIVSPKSGTTRDAIDMEFTASTGERFKLIDTAGIRKKAAVASSKDRKEELSVNRAIRAIRRADVVALVLDALQGPTEQDFRLAELIVQEGRACIIVINKWDTVEEKDSNTAAQYEKNLRVQLRNLDWAPVVFSSALTGQRVQKVLNAALQAGKQHRTRITTSTLNMVLEEATNWKSPPAGKNGKRGKVYYGTQVAVKPPTFVLFVNQTDAFNDSYKRFMEKQFRENVGFPGTPIRIFWRGKDKSWLEQRGKVKRR